MIYPKIDMEKTGQHLKRLCRERNLTTKQVMVELKLGCPQSIYRWFGGQTLPDIGNLLALGGLLGVPVEELIVVSEPDWEAGIIDKVALAGQCCGRGAETASVLYRNLVKHWGESYYSYSLFADADAGHELDIEKSEYLRYDKFYG